jgi:hypothetical protein
VQVNNLALIMLSHKTYFLILQSEELLGVILYCNYGQTMVVVHKLQKHSYI